MRYNSISSVIEYVSTSPSQFLEKEEDCRQTVLFSFSTSASSAYSTEMGALCGLVYLRVLSPYKSLLIYPYIKILHAFYDAIALNKHR